AAQQLIAIWREGVWRNAERVEATRDTPLWPVTLASIELQAELTALVLKNGPIPGRRALRRAHCEAVLAAEAAAAGEPPAAAGGGGGLSWWWLVLVGAVNVRRQRA
ncbi:MAG: GlyGly-CTERM sorting domain-containing protein, partial [Oceanococcaceae bacterium]